MIWVLLWILYLPYDDLLNKSYELIESCPCQDGCPSCVGPSGEHGTGGKFETYSIIKNICGSI